MTSSQCRKQAKERLKGNYSEGFFVTAIVLAAFVIFKTADIAQSAVILYNNGGDAESLFHSRDIWDIAMKAALALLCFVLTSPLITGGVWWYYQTARGCDNRSILKLYTGFKLNVRAIRLYMTIWFLSMLSLLPSGICFASAYELFLHLPEMNDQPLMLFITIQVFVLGIALIGLYLRCITAFLPAPFIFISQPDRGVFAVLKMSVRIMKGSKIQALKLILTYIMLMLPIVTVPFVLPKAVMSVSVFSCDRMGVEMSGET